MEVSIPPPMHSPAGRSPGASQVAFELNAEVELFIGAERNADRQLHDDAVGHGGGSER